VIHGAGVVGWYWHLVERELRTRGHGVVVMDLPVDDDAATLSDHADVVGRFCVKTLSFVAGWLDWEAIHLAA
jgi:hypothetical protein